MSNNPAPGGRQGPASETLSWLDRHAAHILPGHGGFAWMREGSDTTWNWTDTASLSQVAAAGAMFTTNTRFASKPLPTREEGHDRKGLAPRKFGHLTVDLDGETALADLRELLFEIIPLWGLKPENIAVFLSGKKGFHAVIYDAQLGTEDGDKLLPLIYKRLLHDLKETLPSVDITLACMGQGKQFRLPNITRENGLHKIPLKLDEVREGGLTMEQMQALAKSPRLLLLPKVQPGPEISPIRSRVAEIRRQVWSETGARVRTNLSPEDKAALAEALPACQVVLAGMEDYTGGKGLDFDGMCAKLVASFAAEVGLSVTEALEIYGPWAMDFGGSKTYEDPYERLDILGAKLARPALPWDCRIARAMLPPFDCTGCVMRAREVERAFLDDPLTAMLADLPPMPGPVVGGQQATTPGRGFRFLSLDELTAAPTIPKWLVRNYLEAETLAEIFGEAGSMKSFVALDLALCIASGRSWHGHECPNPGAAFFLAGEGFHGLAKRVQAWKVAHGVQHSLPFFVSSAPAQLLDVGQVGEVERAVAALAAVHGAPKLLVIDTLNRNFGPGDENSSADMTSFVAALDRLKAGFGCAVLVVHHSGLTARDRSRGSSVLRAALDFEYKLEAKDGVRVLTNTKTKDHEPPGKLAFVPQDVDTGWTDPETGQAIVSCVMHLTASVQCLGPARPTGAKGLALEALEAIHGQDGKPVHVELWREAAYSQGISPTGTQAAKRQAFKRAVDGLRELGHVVAAGEDLWIPSRYECVTGVTSA